MCGKCVNAKCVKYIKSNVKHSYYKLPQKQYFTSNICKQKSPKQSQE